MADQKISQLSSGTNAQAGDLFVIARGASNFNLTTAQLFNAPSATATLGGLNVDSGTLFVDATNNRVGINQGTPLHPVHVGTTDLILNASGNLGLGVTPSAWAANRICLQIGGSTSGHLAYNAATGNLTTNAFFDTTDNRYEYIGTGAAARYEQAAGVHAWYTATSGSANGAILFTQAMTLDANGKLEIAGRARLSGSQVGNVIENQPTAISVTTSAVSILDDAGTVGRLCVINGISSGDRFCDLVLASSSVAPTVVQSFTAAGSPAARTYTRFGSALQLAMASGTYNVYTLALGY